MSNYALFMVIKKGLSFLNYQTITGIRAPKRELKSAPGFQTCSSEYEDATL